MDLNEIAAQPAEFVAKIAQDVANGDLSWTKAHLPGLELQARWSRKDVAHVVAREIAAQFSEEMAQQAHDAMAAALAG